MKPYSSHFPGKLGEALDRLWHRTRLVAGHGVRLEETPQGVAVHLAAPRAAGAVAFQWLTAVREGYDAVECLTAGGETVYCLKPAPFRSQGFIWEGGTPVFGSVQRHTCGNAATGAGFLALKTYKTADTLVSDSGYAFTVRYIKGASANDGAVATYSDDDTALGSAAFRIGPHYTEYTLGSGVSGYQFLAAASAAVAVDEGDLRIAGAADASATFVDVSPRYWEPLNLFLNAAFLRARSDGYHQSEHGPVPPALYP